MADLHHHPLPRGPLGAALALAALLLPLLALPPFGPAPLRAQSSLLESVRRDPARAKALCRQLRDMNKQGLSYTSKQATRTIATQEGLSLVDAEVLTTYVVGLHCPDVR